MLKTDSLNKGGVFRVCHIFEIQTVQSFWADNISSSTSWLAKNGETSRVVRSCLSLCRHCFTMCTLLDRKPEIIVFIVSLSLLVLKLIHDLPSEH